MAPSSDNLKKLVAALPKNFDWRNRDGVDFVPKVRNQGEKHSLAHSASGSSGSDISLLLLKYYAFSNFVCLLYYWIMVTYTESIEKVGLWVLCDLFGIFTLDK